MESITEIAEKYVLYHSDLRILICRKEKHCLSPGEDKPEDTTQLRCISITFIVQNIRVFPGITEIAFNQYISSLNIAQPHNVQIPSPESRPIPGLELHHEGAECLVCHELMSDVRQMKKHCR